LHSVSRGIFIPHDLCNDFAVPQYLVIGHFLLEPRALLDQHGFPFQNHCVIANKSIDVPDAFWREMVLIDIVAYPSHNPAGRDINLFDLERTTCVGLSLIGQKNVEFELPLLTEFQSERTIGLEVFRGHRPTDGKCTGYV
jgi:hypothetical protein